MSFYANHIEPRLVSCACGVGAIRHERKKIVPFAKGVILEIGFGSGLNLPYYSAEKIVKFYALEPSQHIRKLAAGRVADATFPIEFIDLPGEEIPLEDNSIDMIVITFTMCTIPEVERALQGMRRVLKPGGTMLFAEHGLAPDPGVVKWQNRLNSVWGKLAGGCNLNRNIPVLIKNNGFAIDRMEQAYARNAPKFAGYISTGTAHPV